MKAIPKRLGWKETFKKWINEPCPDGVWLYRGQAAKYKSILPSLLRDSNKRFSGNRLHDIDPRTAYILLQNSPVFNTKDLLKKGLGNELDLNREGFYSYLNRSKNNKVSLSRLIRALAQHYGFPTLFIDLTLDPWVALSFAVYNLSNDKDELQNEEAKVYRWPAKRISPTLLIIDSSNDQASSPIEVIDISGISTYFRRPHNQASTLALPVCQPEFSPELFQTNGAARIFQLMISDLNIVDMLNTPNCENFNVPGALDKQQYNDITQMDSLFPDYIDLGYSYLTIIALLSLISVFPEKEWAIDPGIRGRLNRQFRETIDAARTILDRECFRLVLNMDRSLLKKKNHNLMSARQQLAYQTNLAKIASNQVGSKKFKKALFKSRKILLNKLFAQLKKESLRSFDTLSNIPEGYEVVFDYRNKKIFAVPISEIDFRSDWIFEHIESRFSRVKRVLDLVDKVPAYAFEDRKKYESLFDVFKNDIEYEKCITKCIESQRTLKPNFPVFI